MIPKDITSAEFGKTRVKTTSKDERHNEWKRGDIGYIDGYVRGGDGAPRACVVIAYSRIVMIPLNVLEVI